MRLPLYTTTYKNEVISYIVGFIVKKLMKNLRCAQCINALIGKNDETDQNLINIKNRGSLIYPSRDVIYICKKVDSAIYITMYIKINKNLSNININSFTNDLMQNIFLILVKVYILSKKYRELVNKTQNVNYSSKFIVSPSK